MMNMKKWPILKQKNYLEKIIKEKNLFHTDRYF